MKNEEITTNNNSNKNILNSLVTYNSYNTNDFKKINSSNNIINTSGSQPIVIFKKISKSLTQTFPNHKPNQPLKNNYVSDGGLKKKIGKFKSFSSYTNQGNKTSGNILKNNKVLKAPKTMRNINKNLIVNKKEINTKKEKVISENNDGKKGKTKYIKKNVDKKNKENIKTEKTEYHDKQSHSQGHFNRKNKIFQNNYISKSINGINFNNNKNNIKNNNNNIINKKNLNNNFKKKDINKIKNKYEIKKKQEEEKLNEQKLRKNEYVDSLIKNGVLNITKEFNYVKKLTTKEILNKKKKDFLEENGFSEIITNEELNINNEKIKYKNQLDFNNINIKSIRKKNISTKNSNNIKNKTNNKLNISKSNSRYISFLNNNTNANINMTNTNLITNNLDTQISTKNFKKITLKPQINQFEFLNKIQQEQKKLPGHKKLYTSRGKEKHLQINDYEPKLSDSFRHSNSNSKFNININLDINLNKKKQKNNINLQQNSVDVLKKEKKILEENDEFPFSHKKSYRSQQEIYKYLKEKRIETKKEEENTEKEKQLKAYMTFQNLMNIGKKYDNNITKISTQFMPNKNRKDVKGHMKLRKEPNEYYVGTESSKNNSTFIDKNEYYISILESQKFVNKSKIGKTEDEKDKDKDKENNKIKEGQNNEIDKDKNNKIVKKKLTRGLSSGLFENKRIIDELYTTINKANQIFSKENLNKFKNNLLKLSTEINSTNKENEKILILKEEENEKGELSSNTKIKSPEIKIDIPNTTYSSNNILNTKNLSNNNINLNEMKSSNLKNSLSNYSTSNNNLTGFNSQERFFSHTFSNSLNPNKKIEKKLENKIVINLVDKIKIILKKNIFTFLYKLYLDKYKRKTYSMGFNYLVVICKIYAFKKIEDYTRILEYYEAFKELFKPFIHNKFKKFVKNSIELKIRKFIMLLELFYKYKAMNKLFIYCERDFKREIINFLILTIKKPFNLYVFKKLLLYKNSININNIYNSNNNKKENNIPLNIPLTNKNIYEHDNDININLEDNKENYQFNQNEEMFYDEVNNIFNNNDNYSLNQPVKNIHSIKHIKNNDKMEINTHLKLKDLLNKENKTNFEILTKIKNPENFANEITNLLIEKIINTEIKPFSPLEKIIPNKTFKYDILNKSQNTSLNNSYISSSCASIDQLSLNNNNSFNDPRIQSLNESLISQMSYNSEFNKTIKDKKREQSMSFYVQKIAPKLIQLICDEISNNYNRIYENISTPLRTDFEEIVIALELKNNERLKKNYRILQVEEELKDIISRENIIRKFGIINRKLRKKYNQNIDESFDIFLNLSIIDTAIEIINKERVYGEIGEPFSFYSLRNREIGFKYNKNEPKKLVNLVHKSLMEYINNPIFLIKDSVINADEKKIIKCFKKDLEENECQWEDMEIVETQSKLEVTELILDQLYNEVIEILEHVHLSRKRSDLYQEKSIYACEDIPKLSFQQTTTENEYIQEGGGRDIIGL